MKSIALIGSSGFIGRSLIDYILTHKKKINKIYCISRSVTNISRNSSSGLIDAVTRLKGIKGISQVTLSANDIVRHRLVQQIVEAYEKASVPPRSSSTRRK